jgi:hypothetical protein
MERLTDKVRNYDGTATSKQSLVVEEGLRAGSPSDYCSKIVTKLADYEDAEEQGLLLKLPVAIGSTVYVIDSIYECKFNYDCKLSFDAYKCEEDIRCEHECKKYRPRETRFNHMMLDKIGETVFLTREEAEQKLKELIGE